MQKWKRMVFLDVVEKLDAGEVNGIEGKPLEGKVQKNQGGWYAAIICEPHSFDEKCIFKKKRA